MHIWFIVLSNIHCNLTCDTFFNKRNYIHSHTSYERTSKQTKPQSHMTRYKKNKKQKTTDKRPSHIHLFTFSYAHTDPQHNPQWLTPAHTHAYTRTHAYIHTFTNLHTHTHIHLQTYTRIHTYIYKLTHAYIHTFTNLHTHTYIQLQTNTSLHTTNTCILDAWLCTMGMDIYILCSLVVFSFQVLTSRLTVKV